LSLEITGQKKQKKTPDEDGTIVQRRRRRGRDRRENTKTSAPTKLTIATEEEVIKAFFCPERPPGQETTADETKRNVFFPIPDAEKTRSLTNGQHCVPYLLQYQPLDLRNRGKTDGLERVNSYLDRVRDVGNQLSNSLGLLGTN